MVLSWQIIEKRLLFVICTREEDSRFDSRKDNVIIADVRKRRWIRRSSHVVRLVQTERLIGTKDVLSRNSLGTLYICQLDEAPVQLEKYLDTTICNTLGNS